MNWACNVCHEVYAPDKILEHVRLMHPDKWDAPDTWPDGGAVTWEDADEFFL